MKKMLFMGLSLVMGISLYAMEEGLGSTKEKYIRIMYVHYNMLVRIGNIKNKLTEEPNNEVNTQLIEVGKVYEQLTPNYQGKNYISDNKVWKPINKKLTDLEKMMKIEASDIGAIKESKKCVPKSKIEIVNINIPDFWDINQN